MSHSNDERQSKSVSYLLVILNVLSLMSGGLAYDDNRWNEIDKIANISKSSDVVGHADDTMNNNNKIGLFIFTQYCGPGDRVWNVAGQGKLPSKKTYAQIDVCCKQHDECPNYISGDSDYDRYTGLPHRQQAFSR